MISKISAFFIHLRTHPMDAIILLAFIIAIAGLVRMHLKTQIDDNWDQFKIEHNCHLIEAKGGNNVRTGWVCNDGNEYYRWRQQL